MNGTNENSASNWFTPVRFGILLALLIFAEFPQVILGLESFVARDYGFFVYPLAHFQKQCFLHGELPFWNPYNNCGVPFLAQLNTMPLYPSSLIYLALPLEWSLGFFTLLHLWWAGFGMYFLARRWSGNSFAAAFAGTVFAFNGWSINLLMWPSHIATFAWMPWVVLAAELAWREGMGKIILAAFAGALQMFAGGPETIFLTWLIVSALWLQQFIGAEAPRSKMLWRYPLVVFLVVCLAAPQLFPFLDLIWHSQRESGFADLRWSMPATGPANFLVPMAFGTTGSGGVFFQPGQSMTGSYYLGIATIWLALLSLICLRERRVWLLAGIASVGLVCALGEHTPVLPSLRKLVPQLSMITYPIKYVMVVVFAAPLLAALAIARLVSLSSNRCPGRNDDVEIGKTQIPSPRPSPRPGGEREKNCAANNCTMRLVALGVILLALIGGIVTWTQFTPSPENNARLALISGLSRASFLLLTGLLLYGLTRKARSAPLRFVPLLLILVAWTDVFTHQPTQNPTVPHWVYKPGLSREKLALTPQPELGGSRVMISPLAAYQFVTFASKDPKENFITKRLGYCADCNLLDSVPKVDGFVSLTPRESDQVLSLFYTTTNASYPRLEAFLGVSHYTAPDEIFRWQARTNFLPLATAGQKPVFLADSNVLSALTSNSFDGKTTVFLPPEEKGFVTVTNFTHAKVLGSRFGNDTADIEAEAAEPSLIVIAQTWYHNWAAEVDGEPARLLRANVAFQAVQIPAGRHRIRLEYHDRAFQLGVAIALATLLNCGYAALLMLIRGVASTSKPVLHEDSPFF
jgi:hypothetical protein